MEAQELLKQIAGQAIIALGEKDLPMLLDLSETIRADDTCVAGWIRILDLDGRILVQEQTTEGEILIRRLASRQAAEIFLEHRMETYERMWDG